MKKFTILAIPAVIMLFIFAGTQFTSPENPAFTKPVSVNEDRTEIQSPQDVTNWTTEGYQVKLNGKPFFAKGMGYQPVPVGSHPNDYPNGDYFMKEYSNIYEPDIKKMRDMGVNAIKIYSWYPDKDHNDFLNKCYNGGNKPIYVAVGYFMPPGTIIGEFDAKLKLFKQLAESTKNHPAIMGYMLGNENVGGDVNNSAFWTNYNKIAAALKSIAPNKLTFTGLVDDGMASVKAGNNYMVNLDVWGINVFRGKTLGNFYSTYQSASKKPCFITELGFPATVRENGVPKMMPDNADDVGEYAEDVLNEIHNNSSDDEPDDPIAGVFWFMFCDEWWKQECPACYGSPCACSKSTHDFTKDNYTDNFPGKYWDEEWFGLYTADRQPRAAVNVIKELWGH